MADRSRTSGATGAKRKRRASKPVSRDRHVLYEKSVQSPAEHIQWFETFYRERNGRLPQSFKEDFCGTALLSVEWVRTRDDNTALGVDLHGPTLNWGRKHHVSRLTEEEKTRLTLHQKNVLAVSKPQVDVLAALNFSYWVFKKREQLLEYFKCAYRSVKNDGIFICDIFGGWESYMEETDKTRYGGYTYVWEQRKYDPITNETEFHIHFKLHGGRGEIRSAFVYDWRMWSIPEVRELLEEAGFTRIDVYWEQIDDDTDEGSGDFERVTTAENTPGWIAFIVASRHAARKSR